jgi:hypothetical protein
MAPGVSSPSQLLKVGVRITLQLAIYLQSVRLGAKPLVAHELIFFFAIEPLPS